MAKIDRYSICSSCLFVFCLFCLLACFLLFVGLGVVVVVGGGGGIVFVFFVLGVWCVFVFRLWIHAISSVRPAGRDWWQIL